MDSKESIPPAYVACRYDNHIPTRFLTQINCLKIQALLLWEGGRGGGGQREGKGATVHSRKYQHD